MNVRPDEFDYNVLLNRLDTLIQGSFTLGLSIGTYVNIVLSLHEYAINRTLTNEAPCKDIPFNKEYPMCIGEGRSKTGQIVVRIATILTGLMVSFILNRELYSNVLKGKWLRCAHRGSSRVGEEAVIATRLCMSHF